ncbi:hypothetical protein FSP39_001412, partial [Pinctada imbricata]
KKAKRRIVIASLYLGTGSLEQDLVEAIRHACKSAKESGTGDFEVHILLDYVRGSRGQDVTSRTMLTPLLEEFKDVVSVYLYHTPHLRGMLRQYIPQRFNEVIGLNHMKIYLFDDSFIISGANLSDQYFVNRQDRYVLFKDCAELADFFTNVVKTVGKFSFLLKPDDTTCLYPGWNAHPYDDEDNGKTYIEKARQEVLNFLQSVKSSSTTITNSDLDTCVYPLIQMGPFGIDSDEKCMKRLFHSTPEGDTVYLASGYFNLTEQYKNIIVHESEANYKILSASPQVNGFFGASGIAGKVPDTYTAISRKFFQTVCYHDQENRVQLMEYYRDKWTFHVKGLWYYSQGNNLPHMSIVGSSNFGYRSVYRDLECQVAIVTTNSQLQQQLKEEQEGFYEKTKLVTAETFQQPDRFVPYWVRLLVPLVKKFF